MVILLTKTKQGYWDNNGTNTTLVTTTTSNHKTVTSLVVARPYQEESKNTTATTGKNDNHDSNISQDTTSTAKFTSLSNTGNKGSHNKAGGKSSAPQKEMTFSTGSGSSSVLFELD